MPNALERLLREAYSETQSLLRDPELGSVVKQGFIISYGPPIVEPDLLLISFQGGGDTLREGQTTWPERLLYLDSPYKFGKNLRSFCREAGLYNSLETSAMAFPAVFPQAPTSEASKWKNNGGPYAKWRRHSTKWVRELVTAAKPKVVILFGVGASDVLEITWKERESNHGQGWQTFGVSEFCGAPAVFCNHLSQGYRRSEVLKSLAHAKTYIG